MITGRCRTQPGSRRVASTVSVLCALIALLLQVAPAFAQTATPTPTATVTPLPTVAPSPTIATPAPTPTLIPGDPNMSTVVWGCWVVNGQAPVCTWSDYFEMWITAHKAVGDGQPLTVYAPEEDSSRYGHMVIVPPAYTKEIQATCEYAALVAEGDFGLGAASANAQFGVGTNGTYTDFWVDDVLRSDGAYGFETLNCSGTPMCSAFDNGVFTMRARLKGSYASWPAPINTPGDWPSYATRQSYFRFYMRAEAGANADEDNYARGSVRMACQITKVIRLDDSEYVPTQPVAGVTPMPGWTPSVCLPDDDCWVDWVITPFPPVAFVPVSNTVEIDIGTPGEAVCHTIVPAWGIQETIYGYDIDFGWAPFRLCPMETSFGVKFLGVDFGAYLTVVIGVIGLGAVAKLFSRGA